MSDFWSIYGSPAASSTAPYDPFAAETQRREEGLQRIQDNQPYQRGFLERLFAPIQAPQETLFRFTQEVADNGFQPGDILRAMSHGARYFNPWSNEKPIDPNEIRDIFFGDQAKGVTKFLQNTAITLLYDPLLFVGLAKGAKVLKEGTTTARVLSGIANPAEVMVDVLRAGSRKIVAPAVRKVGVALKGGEEAYNVWATRMAQNLVSKYAGVPEFVVQASERMDQEIYRWREEAVAVMKQAQSLRGSTAQRLLAEALEMDSFYMRAAGENLTQKQLNRLAQFDRKLAASGIDQDEFLQVYSRFRSLDDDIGMGLMNAGMISPKEMEAFRGQHLRRMYAAWEKPEQYLDRLEKLAETRPDLVEDTVRYSKKALYDELGQFRSELQDFSTGKVGLSGDVFSDAVARGAFQGTAANSRYFSSDGRLNVRDLVDDLTDFLDRPDTGRLTPMQVIDHIRDNMLDGVAMPAEFWKSMGNHLARTEYTQKGIRSFQDRLTQMAYGGSTTFRTVNERLEVIAKRENISPLIAEALGEVLEATPRIASEASDAGRLLATRHFTDTLAGSVRLTDDVADLLNEFHQVRKTDWNHAQAIAQDIADRLGVQIDPTDLIDKNIGDILSRQGSRVASHTRTAKHTVQVPAESGYGELAGMWVDPGTFTFVSRLGGISSSAHPTRQLAEKFMEQIRLGTGYFKLMKAVLDPVAQFRNLIGNAILMDMAGVNPLRVDRLIKSNHELRHFITTGEQGKYLKLAEQAGSSIFQHTFSRVELQEMAEGIILDPITKDNWRDVLQSMMSGFQRSFTNYRERMVGMFEFNEKLFKLNVFSAKYDELAANVARAGKALDADTVTDLAKQAAAAADQALFNYADVPYIADVARQYGIVPFITFPLKATPFIGETLHKNPWRVLKYERFVGQVNEAVAGSPDQVAQEIEGLPQHIRDGLVVKLPWKDQADRPLYIDLSYFMPWYIIQDLAEQVGNPLATVLGASPEGVDFRDSGGFRGGVLTPPAMALVDAIRRNEDSLGRPIVKPDMDARQRWQAIGRHVAQFILPPSLYGTRADSIGRALQAAAQSGPETAEWADILGRSWRLGGEQDETFPRPGFLPQSQAQMGASIAGMEPTNPLNVALTSALGFVGGGMQASDQVQQAIGEQSKMQANASEVAREIARIRTSSLPHAEKVKRILRLQQQLQQSNAQSADRFRRLF